MRVTRDAPLAPLETKTLHSHGGWPISDPDSIPSFFINFDLGKVIKLLGLNFLAYKTCLGTN